MVRRIGRCGLRVFLIGLLAGGLLGSGGAFAAITASPELTVTLFAATAWAPTTLAFGPGGPLGASLYVVEWAPGGEGDRLVALDPASQRTVLAQGLQRPTSVLVGAGGAWGSVPYILEGPGGNGVGLRVVQVPVRGPTIRWSLPPGGARAAGGLALSPGGGGAKPSMGAMRVRGSSCS